MKNKNEYNYLNKNKCSSENPERKKNKLKKKTINKY
jgi:hypothetical protein